MTVSALASVLVKARGFLLAYRGFKRFYVYCPLAFAALMVLSLVTSHSTTISHLRSATEIVERVTAIDQGVYSRHHRPQSIEAALRMDIGAGGGKPQETSAVCGSCAWCLLLAPSVPAAAKAPVHPSVPGPFGVLGPPNPEGLAERMEVIDAMLEHHKAICRHFTDLATYSMYSGLVTCAFIGYLILRRRRATTIEMPVVNARVHAKTVVLILLCNVMWMWMLFGYTLGSALTAKARSMIYAAAIDHVRYAQVAVADQGMFYQLSAVHRTEQGEVIDILFGCMNPVVWGSPLGGAGQRAASIFIWIITYGMALGVLHAGAALALREVSQTRLFRWKLAAWILSLLVFTVLAGTHAHFASEFPELGWHAFAILAWGLLLTVLMGMAVDRYRARRASRRSAAKEGVVDV